MILNKHPFTEALIPLLPQFEQQTGIKTTNLILPEAEYFQNFFTALYEDPTKSKVAGKNALALPPHGPGRDPFSSVWTWALGMSARSADKNAAWYFIQWATAKRQMLRATVDGQNYNPTRKSVFDSADVQKAMKSWATAPTCRRSWTTWASTLRQGFPSPRERSSVLAGTRLSRRSGRALMPRRR